MKIRTRRVYESISPDEGFRILVDRMWPRGMTKEQVRADLWMKDAAPSASLRKWFGHEPAKWEGFKSRYYLELDAKPEVVGWLVAKGTQGQLTLLFSARDSEYNQAVALREYLLSRITNPIV